MEEDSAFYSLRIDPSPAKSNISVDIFASDNEEENIFEVNNPNITTFSNSADRNGNKSKNIIDFEANGNKNFDDEIEMKKLPSSSSKISKKEILLDCDDDENDIEILPFTSKRQKRKMDLLNDDGLTDIEIINPRKWHESKPFFVPRDPSKPKIDLYQFVRKPEILKDDKIIKLASPENKKKKADDEKAKLEDSIKKSAKNENFNGRRRYAKDEENFMTTTTTKPTTKIEQQQFFKKQPTAKRNLSQFMKSAAPGPSSSILKPERGQTKIDQHLFWKNEENNKKSNIPAKSVKLQPLSQNDKNRNISKTSTSKAATEQQPMVLPRLRPLLDQSYKTPPKQNLKRSKFGRSPSPEYSPLPAAMAAKLKASLESPGFLAKKHSSTAKVYEEMKKKAALKPKCKDSRKLMNGYECNCCKSYYDSLGLKDEERREYVNKVSKHRGFQEMPATPPRYWDLDVPTPEEARELGWVIYTDSPLFKTKPKKY